MRKSKDAKGTGPAGETPPGYITVMLEHMKVASKPKFATVTVENEKEKGEQ